MLSPEIPPKDSWAVPLWGPARTCQARQTEVALLFCLCLNMDLRSSGGWCRAEGSSISHWWCLQGESSVDVRAALLYNKSRALLLPPRCGKEGRRVEETQKVFLEIKGRETSATWIHPTREKQVSLIATDLAAHPTERRIGKGFHS